jgi:hypothetical protein
MKPFQERVIEEKSSLDDKCVKLHNFIYSDTFNTLPQQEQWRMIRQLAAMQSYSEVLGERINAF